MHHIEKRRVHPRMLDAKSAGQPAVEWFSLLDYHLTHLAGRAPKTAESLRRLICQGHPESRDT
jgi:hypothetical protein